MSPLSSKDLHRIFEKIDKNGDGLVSLDELKWLLEKMGVQTSLNELELLVAKPSLDIVDFLFFCDTFINRDIDESKNGLDNNGLESDLVKAFKVFDLNGDGFISSDELKSVLSRLGLWDEQSGKDCNSIISAYDINSDGLLDFEEFKKMMYTSS